MYDAFISYSQRKDKAVATALRSVIQSIGNPWWRIRSVRVFLDSTSLSAAPELWPAIESKLRVSRLLVLLASPEAGRSYWVDREVRWWLDTDGKGIDRLLIALTDGTLEWSADKVQFADSFPSPLPPSLRERFKSEPLWVDLRNFREAPERAHKKDPEFLSRALDLAAAIRMLPKEDLYSEELKSQRRNLAWSYSAIIGLSVLATAAAGAAWIANAQRNRAERVLDEVLKSSNNLVFEMSRQLSDDIGVPQALVVELLKEARKPMDALQIEAHDRPDVALSRALALMELSSALSAQGEIDAAVEAAKSAGDLLQQRSPNAALRNKWRLARSGSFERLGDALLQKSENLAAFVAFQTSLAIAQELAIEEPLNPFFQQAVAVSLQRLGEYSLIAGNLAEAEQHFLRSMAIRESVRNLPSAPDNAPRELATALERIGTLYLKQKRTDEAKAAFLKALAIVEPRASFTVGAQSHRDLAILYQKLGEAAAAMGQSDDARSWFERDIKIARLHVARDGTRVLWQTDLISSLERRAAYEAGQGNIAEAISLQSQTVEISKSLTARDPKRRSWQRDQALLYETLARLRARSGDGITALDNLKQALALREKFQDLEAGDPRLQRQRSLVLKEISQLEWKHGNAKTALVSALQYLALARSAPETEGKTERIAQALGTVTWTALIAEEFDQAVTTGREAVELAGGAKNLSWVKLNLAHALLMSGQQEEARSIYKSGMAGDDADATKWKRDAMSDFEILRERGFPAQMILLMENEFRD